MNKDQLINNLHKLYRKDPYIQQIFNSAGITLDNLDAAVADVAEQYWFDEMTWGIPILEGILDFKTDDTAPIADRRSQLEARWKSYGKTDISLIQAICNSWHNGQVKVDFVDGKIKLTFNGEYGIPNDLKGLQDAIDNVKPAHLAITYAFRYLLIKDIHNKITLAEIEQKQLDDFAF